MYKELEDKLKELECKRIQHSVWYLQSDDYTCQELKEELIGMLNPNDRLIVAECKEIANHGYNKTKKK